MVEDSKPFIVKIHDVHMDSEYIQWICDLKARYHKTQIKTAVKVNSEQLLFLTGSLDETLWSVKLKKNGAKEWLSRSASIYKRSFQM